MSDFPLFQHLTAEQWQLFSGLDSPAAIQAYLDNTPYSPESRNRCTVSVMRDRLAHCLDGGLFAAAALRRLGYPPLIVDLLPEPGSDDDHILAVYKQHGRWGCVAKSNYVGLRSRSPVYHSLRELVMSYFDVYFNVYGERTLRAYTRPVNLASMDNVGWMDSDAGVDAVEQRLYRLSAIPLISPEMAAGLVPVDPLTLQACTIGTNMDGVFKPQQKD